ncbi:MAG: RHS repeat protein, partial [Caldilineaceae bacterium]|nr:RHS repeat protein [Caldilineaceae bacterium]
ISKDVTQVDDNGNAYARLPGNSTITSAPFTIGAGVQQLALMLTGLTTKSDQYQVKVLSDPSFATVTLLGSGTVSDSWQQFAYNVSAWQGQVVKLQIASAYTLGAVGVDDIGIQSITIPGWSVTGATQVVDEGNGNHFVATNGELLSDSFVLDPNVQQISLRYRSDDGAADTFYVKLLRGANFSEEIDLAGYQSAGASWQTLKIGINLYAGETVKLKLQRHFGSIYFDDVAAGEIILPGWQPTGTEGIVTATDSYGSYVTAANSPALYIRSIPIDTGIINHPFRTDARYYAVAYDIGYSTGNLFQVFWINDQGQQYTAFQDAANSPTGYRERYFQINEAVGTSGHFVIKVTGGGKVYSIADNIARQHLNEPFSYKVGIRIDTSTGAFGYQAEDLRVAGNTPLIFTRYYNGHSDRLGAMGYGWSHSYETRLVITEDDDAGVIFGAGKEIFFIWDANSQTFSPADARVYDDLVKNGDGSYTYTTKSNQRYNFNAAGVLQTIQDPNDNTVTLGYDGNGRLATITAQGGATVTLGYDGNGRLATATNPLNAATTYSYDANGDLISVARPDAGTEQYSYSSHRLSQVIDATGHTLFQNSFDTIHRVVQQTDALGKSLTIQYGNPAAGVTTVTDPEGGVTTYYFDSYQRTTDWVAPTGAITSYLYDAVGNLDKVIDGG